MEEALKTYLEDIDEFDHDCVKAICEAVKERFSKPTFEKVTRIYERGYYIFYPNMDLDEVAVDLIRSCTNFPREWEKYIKFDKMVEDLQDEGYLETIYGTIYLE